MNTATMVFLLIGALGLVLLGLGLFGGHLHIGQVDLHMGHVEADSMMTMEVLAGFLGTFGFSAAIACELLDARTPAAVAGAAAIGAVAAVPGGYLALKIGRAARNMPTDATPTRDDLIGTLGTVVTPIPADGYGAVRVQLAGQPVNVNARSNKPVAAGARVFVVEAPSDTSVIVEETLPLT